VFFANSKIILKHSIIKTSSLYCYKF